MKQIILLHTFLVISLTGFSQLNAAFEKDTLVLKRDSQIDQIIHLPVNINGVNTAADLSNTITFAINTSATTMAASDYIFTTVPINISGGVNQIDCPITIIHGLNPSGNTLFLSIQMSYTNMSTQIKTIVLKIINKEITEVKTPEAPVVDGLKDDPITETNVGTISLTGSLLTIYKEGGSLLKMTTIDSVNYSIEGGKLSRKLFYVQTKDGTFLNYAAPVPVIKINERGGDKLWNIKTTNKSYILLGDVVEYRAKDGGGYVPDDAENLKLTPENYTNYLSASSNLNSLINFSVYTDLAGLLGRRANGLLITDVTGKFITNTGNLLNKDITPFSFIEGNVTLSKFDSKFKSIDSSYIKFGNNGERDTVDRMQLIQTAWLKGSMKFNLLSIRFISSQYLDINIGTRINVVNGDSLFRKERDIIFFDYYPEVIYTIKRLKNFSMDISLKWLQQRIADREPFSNNGWESVFNPQIAFFYYPTTNPNKKVYLRFNYFANKNKNANNFYQLQFGWKTGFSPK